MPGGGGGGGGGLTKGFAAELGRAIEDGSSLENAVLQMAAEKFSSMVLIPRDRLDLIKAIGRLLRTTISRPGRHSGYCLLFLQLVVRRVRS